ncbi:MAG: CIA30 family protein [Fibrobacteria bacterium]|nr:CIA30 family protein [Fibrobacteria bacterium]
MSKNLSEWNKGDSWHTTDDVVMGGISSSSFTVQKSGTGIFEGNVSLENNGGFSSLKGEIPENGFSGFSGIRFKARGDGKKYKLYVKDHNQPGGINYQYEFMAESGISKIYSCPFSEFIPVSKGKLVTAASSLESDKIRFMGFIIANRQNGNFKLEIEWIEGYKENSHV